MFHFRSQYYIYKKKYNKYGELGLEDKRNEGGNTNFESEDYRVYCC